VLQFLPALLSSTDVGVKDPTHHYAYGVLLLAGLTYNQPEDEAMSTFSKIMGSPLFRKKVAKVSNSTSSKTKQNQKKKSLVLESETD
jgi:hypothetical protein